MGKCAFGDDNVSEFTVSSISSDIGRILEKRHSLESGIQGGFNDTPFVCVESFRRFIRDLECVGCSDLIVVLTLADVLALLSLLIDNYKAAFR
jgi:hypothetical protein